MAINDITTYREYPKPHPLNLLQDDVVRLRSALDGIDTDMHAKLDTAVYTASDILSKMTSVDGAGSGLDADLLDGSQASDFAASTHGHAAATTDAAGFMSTTDKTKLDGIATGAQVNTITSVNSKTGAVVLTATDVGAIATTGISDPLDGQVLLYNAASSQWVNRGGGTSNAKSLFFSSF